MKRVPSQRDESILGDIRIREIHREHRELLLDGGTQEERLTTLKPQFESAQVSGAFVVEPLFAVANRQDVPFGFEDAEVFTMLEDSDAVIEPRTCGHDVVLIVDLNYLVHEPALDMALR